MSPRVVFDCMVFLSAAARPAGAAAACLQLVRDRRVELYLSPAVLAEVREVLLRPRVRRKFPTLTDAAVEVFLREVESQTVLLSAVPAVFASARDPKDEPYVNLASAANARYLVSWDRDLLDLMTETVEGRAFRERFPNLVILDPAVFLQELRSEQPASDRSPADPNGSV